MAVSIAKGQSVSDTIHIGSGTYVHFKSNYEHGFVSARITNDSLLTIYDATGAVVNYPVQRWVLSITVNDAYREVEISGPVVPVKCREWMNEQLSGGWICIEGVTILMPDGTERKLVGEKWVKL